jgi:hypothetical protein
MFSRIVVGINGRSGGRDALALARELAGGPGEIALAHVHIESLLPARGSPGVFQAGEREYSRELLEAARSESGLDATLCPVASPSVVDSGEHQAAWRTGQPAGQDSRVITPGAAVHPNQDAVEHRFPKLPIFDQSRAAWRPRASVIDRRPGHDALGKSPTVVRDVPDGRPARRR